MVPVRILSLRGVQMSINHFPNLLFFFDVVVVVHLMEAVYWCCLHNFSFPRYVDCTQAVYFWVSVIKFYPPISFVTLPLLRTSSIYFSKDLLSVFMCLLLPCHSLWCAVYMQFISFLLWVTSLLSYDLSPDGRCLLCCVFMWFCCHILLLWCVILINFFSS